MNISEQLKKEKYVAYLDVLGFKEIVSKKGNQLNNYYAKIDMSKARLDRC